MRDRPHARPSDDPRRDLAADDLSASGIETVRSSARAQRRGRSEAITFASLRRFDTAC